MKRIAIFCDGTWNSPKMPETTHVEKLCLAAKASEPDENKQVARYFPGVGARRGLGTVERWVDKAGGGAFGWGLTRNIKEAYAELAAHYQPGDQIYLFRIFPWRIYRQIACRADPEMRACPRADGPQTCAEPGDQAVSQGRRGKPPGQRTYLLWSARNYRRIMSRPKRSRRGAATIRIF